MRVNLIDVGCAHYGSFKSIEHICDDEAFDVGVAFGLDPRCEPQTYWHEQTLVTMVEMAAWTSTGSADWQDAALGSGIVPNGGVRRVKTIDLAALVLGLAPVVLKIDAEGAEWDLVPHLLAHGLMAEEFVRLAWIEWHDRPGKSADELIGQLGCEYAEWKL